MSEYEGWTFAPPARRPPPAPRSVPVLYIALILIFAAVTALGLIFKEVFP